MLGTHPAEEERLRVLRQYEILDTPPEQTLDDLVALAAGVCDAPVALLGLVDAHRDWFKARFGAVVVELPRTISFCGHTLAKGGPLVVPDALLDPRFQTSPLVTGAPHVRFYAGVPLYGRGQHLIGTICVIDIKPRSLSTVQLDRLSALARQAQSLLELRLLNIESRNRETELRAAAERLTLVQAERDELISFVVHDLKNPLAGILLNARFGLASLSNPAQQQETLADIVAHGDGMLRLLNDMLDIKRGRGRLALRAADVPWSSLAAELGVLFNRRSALEDRHVDIQGGDSQAPLCVDTQLMLRVLQNLVDNALKYATSGGSIAVTHTVRADGAQEISVADDGPGIPVGLREQIFEPFIRVDGNSPIRGQGLGLAFCRLAVEAHGGTIVAEQNVPQGTVFRVRLPARPPAQAPAPLPVAGTGWTSSRLSRTEMLAAHKLALESRH